MGLEPYGRLICSAPWTGCTVHWTGVVFPCCSICEDYGEHNAHAHNMILGDLKKESLKNILNSEAIWRFRRAWIEGALSGYCCTHCHANRLYSCSPYFREDVWVHYVNKNYERDGDTLRRTRFKPFPVTRLEVQINASCQLRCCFCNMDYIPTGTPRLMGHGHMDVELFESLLDQVIKLGGERAELFTHWSGEPLLHPQKEQIYEIVGHRPFFNPTIVTNGVKLTPSFVDHLLSLPKVPKVYISLHAATSEAFLRTTGKDLFAQVRNNIIYLLQKRSEAKLQDEMCIFIGYTVSQENVDDLKRFLDEWCDIFSELDQPPTIHLNGRGRSSRNTLIVVADALDPFSYAMKRAFWIVEEARSSQEPSMDELLQIAEHGGWGKWDDPIGQLLDQQHRVESRMIYSDTEQNRRRYSELLQRLLIAQGRYETSTVGMVSDQTAGRLLSFLHDDTGEGASTMRQLLVESEDCLFFNTIAYEDIKTQLKNES